MKEPVRQLLTNQSLRGLFKSNFVLANQAIRLARFYIRSGHEITMDRILEEIRKNPHEDYLRDLEALENEPDEIDTEAPQA